MPKTTKYDRHIHEVKDGTWYDVGQHSQSRLHISDDVRILADKLCVLVEQTI